ncbi:hypothetical protein P154DRAFT_517236 [Amniculicola lignicola CBS 123094]|uniref:Uncharacterized protein n=1 Tax=Amniculicola lignicola CBS 123094 TaxID=1392246 RepID=A0A6A5X3U8_9PLEO|nr:hypothetical protein P154DRAFT_517236 [Amniculicola lignicola CBS 123094]
MAAVRPNKATTKNGEKYNKLTRPDDYIASLNGTTLPPSLPPAFTRPAKRQYDSDSDSSFVRTDDERDLKRARIQNGEDVPNDSQKTHTKRKPNNNADDYGPRTLIEVPSIDEDGGYASDDPDYQVYAYLRDVRTEASSIPALLVAPREVREDGTDRSMDNEGHGDFGTVYQDGTFVARELSPATSSTSSDEQTMQDIYSAKLLRRYKVLRQKLESATYKDLRKHMEVNPGNCTDKPPPSNRYEWRKTLDRHPPTPAQLCQMDDFATIRGIEYCTTTFGRFEKITKAKSTWIWALLAKVPDVGALSTWQVGKIRDLAVTARNFGDGIQNGVKRHREQDSDEDEEDFSEDADVEVVPDVDCESGVDKEIMLRGSVDVAHVDVFAVSDDEEDGEAVADGVTTKQAEDGRVETISKSGETALDNMPEPQIVSPPQQNNTADTDSLSDVEMDISSDEEGEVKEDEAEETLEEAKARLLAQLGNRLKSRPQKCFKKVVFPSRAEAEMHLAQTRNQQDHALPPLKLESPPEEQTQDTVAGAKPDQNDDFGFDLNTRVTIDMIITIAAECYGQKDLLQYRSKWI